MRLLGCFGRMTDWAFNFVGLCYYRLIQPQAFQTLVRGVTESKMQQQVKALASRELVLVRDAALCDD